MWIFKQLSISMSENMSEKDIEEECNDWMNDDERVI